MTPSSPPELPAREGVTQLLPVTQPSPAVAAPASAAGAFPPSRCPHCGCKPRGGAASRYGIENMRARLANGDLLKEIAFDLGISISTLQRWCAKRNLHTQRSHFRTKRPA